MWVEYLRIESFRRIVKAEVNFGPGLNIIFGENAQGKTSVLQALMVLTGEESRFQPEYLRFGSEFFLLKGKFVKDDGVKAEVTASYIGGQGRRTINGKERSGSDVKKAFPVVSLDAETVTLVKGEPSQRRKFLDEFILRLKPHYNFLRAAYYRALYQRQRALMEEDRFGGDSLNLYLDELENIMSQQGAKIVKYRAEAALKLERKARELKKEAYPLESDLSLKYQAVAEGREEVVRKLIKEGLSQSRARDREKRRATFGPHLDELAILLGNKPARAFASEGEKKEISFLLELAVREVIAEETGESPLFLVDDFPSVLDERAVASLISFLQGRGQVVLALTSQLPKGMDFPACDKKSRIFRVEKGEIRAWNTSARD